MSTKQAVVFAFMLVFLITTVVTMALWFHFSLDLDVKSRALKTLGDRKTELGAQRDKLTLRIMAPSVGLEAKVKHLQQTTDDHIQQLLRDPSNSRIKLYDDLGTEIATKWGPEGEAAKAWRSVYADWLRENTAIKEARTKLATMDKTSLQQVEQDTNALRDQLEEEEKRKRETILKRQEWTAALGKIRNQAEDTQERVNEVTRELEKVEGDEKDGEVIYSSKAMVTVDIGYVHGAKEGLKFSVFSGRHAVPVRKGAIRLVAIRAASSDAIILEEADRILYDKVTGWEAPDPGMRYSIYAAGGTDGTEPQPLEEKKSKRQKIREQRLQKEREERLAAGAEETAVVSEHQALEPQIQLGKGIEPIIAGDWISNPEYHAIVPTREFNRKLVNDLLAMGDISLNPQTFYFSPMVSAYRQEFLKRLCNRNQCKSAPQMSAEIDFIVTSPDTTRLDLLKQRLGDIKPEELAAEADLPPDRVALIRTYKALLEGQKYGTRAISESDLEKYFLARGRKKEILSGKTKQLGQSAFFVVGQTLLRSIRETGLYIQEHGGVMATSMDDHVDYLVVGKGMDDAKWDPVSRKIYYPSQKAPATAIAFSEAVKLLGLKVIRESELPKFFGR